MNMKTNYLKLNSWAVAALMGMCSLAACSDDNSCLLYTSPSPRD